MKTWLFDILACPLDKSFPLKLYIFSFENEPEEFQSLIKIYEKRDINFIKNEALIELSHDKNGSYIRDNIIIEKTNLKNYLTLIYSSLIEFENIFDKSSNKFSRKCIELMNSTVKSRIMEFIENPNSEQFDKILPELYFINKIKLDFEIKTGLLYCSSCKRWYPIIDTIPQMLPDKYRDEIKDVEFLERHKNLLEKEFFDQDIKPYKIKKKNQ
ncbi:MAG: Trm112 family protein [Candidatus Thorarchaeota archaeon]